MDDSVAPATAPTKKAAAKSAETQVKELASDVLDRLQQRFTRLKACTGVITDNNQWSFTLTGPKIFDGDRVVGQYSCEAKFPPGVSQQKIYLSFYGYCEANAAKLGVPMRKADGDAE